MPSKTAELTKKTQADLRHVGAGTLESVKLDEMEAIAEEARRTNRPIVPALIDDISQWVLNPRIAAIMAFGLSFGVAATAEDEAAHPKVTDTE